MDRAETGRRGEHAAALYYIRRGCTLLEHNYRIREGEIDLILLPARRLGHPGQAPPDRPDGGLVPAADRPAGGLCAVRCGGSDPS